MCRPRRSTIRSAFFERRVWRIRKPQPEARDIDALVALHKESQSAADHCRRRRACTRRGGRALATSPRATGIPVAETQAGKGALAWDHPAALGSIGVTGSSAANEAAPQADVVVAIGTRLQDFTSGSRTLFEREGIARSCKSTSPRTTPTSTAPTP